MRLEVRDKRKLGELGALLRCNAAEGDLASAVVPELGSFLGFERAGFYGFRLGDDSLSIEFAHGLGGTAMWTDFESALRACPRWTFDPFRVEVSERNRVVTVRAGDATPWRDLPSVVQLASHHPWVNGAEHQMRMLICDGPVLLAWIGGYRAGGGVFTERERRLFQSLAQPLRERFRLERDLGRGRLASAILPAALEEIAAAAFVVSGAGRVAFANSAGRARLEEERTQAAEVRSALAAVGHPRFRWSALPGGGIPLHYLAIERRTPPAHHQRAAAHARRWGLTPRQAEVLGLLALGRANKVIAAELGCGEATVEFHVTSLLEKAGAQSRAELTARFWSEE